MDISQYIERRLAKFNEIKKINVPTDKTYIQRVREAIEKSNSLAERVSIEVNGEDVTQKHRHEAMLPIPEAFGKPTSKTYQSLASDGTMLSLDVLG